MADPTYLRYLASCDQAKALQWADSDVYVEPVPAFPSSVAALEYAAEAVARLSKQVRRDGSIDSCELAMSLESVAAILDGVA